MRTGGRRVFDDEEAVLFADPPPADGIRARTSLSAPAIDALVSDARAPRSSAVAMDPNLEALVSQKTSSTSCVDPEAVILSRSDAVDTERAEYSRLDPRTRPN